jgi:hypothetical protein
LVQVVLGGIRAEAPAFPEILVVEVVGEPV